MLACASEPTVQLMPHHPDSARILVVDDDPITAALGAHTLGLLGHQATVQPDPALALVQARSGQFDGLLLEMQLRRRNALEALASLRTDEARSAAVALPVIAVSNDHSAAHREHLRRAGADEHLGKPVSAGLLGAAIERVLATRGRAVAQTRNHDAERLRRTVERLGDVRPGDRAFAPTVIESFALRAAQLIEAMGRALETDDFEAGSRSARALKSSAEFLGALGLADLCGQAAGHCERGHGSAARETLQRLDNEHQAVLTLLLSRQRRA